MNILITGASGFIGTNLIKALVLQNRFNIRTLSRFPQRSQASLPSSVVCYQWNPEQNKIDKQALNGVDIVINLAGENIASGRWTKEKKKTLLSSRINGTKLLIDEIKKLDRAPSKFISVSAIGFYGNRESEEINEDSSEGKGFLANLCSQWETQAQNHNISLMSTTIIRIGIVLGKDGGALEKMLTPFKLGAGGKIGNGNQVMSWIHIVDLIRIFQFIIESKDAKGIYNATAPSPVSNKEFTHRLGKVLNRPTLFTVPALALKLLLGELSEVLLEGQYVVPKKLTSMGFMFKYAELEKAFNSIFDRDA
jgi:uncharacterized protein (TIGR01777 family)